MDLLKEWKGKIKETFKDVVGELDPAEKRLSDMVERATHEALPSPDFALNLAVVDEVNGNPRCVIGEPIGVISGVAGVRIRLHSLMHLACMRAHCITAWTCMKGLCPFSWLDYVHVHGGQSDHRLTAQGSCLVSGPECD